METSSIIETDKSFGQLQEWQDNASFLPSNYNICQMVHSKDIFHYYASLFGGPHTAIEDPIFLAPENIKAFIQALNLSKFRGRVVIVLDIESGHKPKEDITLVLTKFGYLDQERELVRKKCNNIDYILSCCIYDLEIVLGEMRDKAKTRLAGMDLRLISKIGSNFSPMTQNRMEIGGGLGPKGEAIATFKLAEEQAPGNFYCLPNFSNSNIEPQPVPCGWYPWIERKVKTLKKNNIPEQVADLRDHYQKKTNREIVPIVKELYEKKINPVVYFLWPHFAQEWKAWIPGFMSGMWSRVWRNEKERIEFMNWMGQDLLNDKISEPMEETLERYQRMHNQKLVQNLFCVLLIKWIPRSLKEPLDEEQTN
uniref:Uncharacterized protein n=1 Tax=Romanomermis culicivorax TaxID=13658 RepID=A0A915KWM5_ROMCU